MPVNLTWAKGLLLNRITMTDFSHSSNKQDHLSLSCHFILFTILDSFIYRTLL